MLIIFHRDFNNNHFSSSVTAAVLFCLHSYLLIHCSPSYKFTNIYNMSNNIVKEGTTRNRDKCTFTLCTYTLYPHKYFCLFLVNTSYRSNSILTGSWPHRMMTSQEDDLTGRWPHRKTTSQKDDHTGRQPHRKTTSQEDDLTGRQPHRKTTSQEVSLRGKQPHRGRQQSQEDNITEG